MIYLIHYNDFTDQIRMQKHSYEGLGPLLKVLSSTVAALMHIQCQFHNCSTLITDFYHLLRVGLNFLFFIAFKHFFHFNCSHFLFQFILISIFIA